MKQALITIPELIFEGKIKPDPIIKKHFPFKQYHNVYAFIGESGNNVLKVMVDLQ